MWSEAEQRELEEILKKYPHKRSAILPALYLAQREKNWLDEEDIAAVAEALDVPVTDVHAIIGFYTLLRKEKTGRYLVQVCTDLPCALRGAEDFFRRLTERLGLPPEGGTTADGLFTVEPVVCIAACDKAPCAQINLEYHENLTDEKIDQILSQLRTEAAKDT
ncbi:MAG: NAD(P)H-dependent oxidoreductase subunit E [Caldilineae bacterium]|nr:MAG: NAD(P)H-dependent oxidoreductase subunit E [Caldilineae bacterium]